MTTIHDTLPYADGRLASGRIVVSWPPFEVGGASVAGGMQAFDFTNGALDVTLTANSGALPLGMYYTAAYELEEGVVYSEYWVVPDLPTCKLGQVRVAFPVTPSAAINAQQLTSSGAVNNQYLGWDGNHWTPMTLPAGVSGLQSPWTSDIDGNNKNLANAHDIDITGTYRRAGVPLSISLQNVVTGSRAAGVVYRNTGGKVLFVNTCWDLAGKASTLSFRTDAATPPTTEVTRVSDPSAQAGVVLQLFAMVLPNNYYTCTVTAGTPGLISWVEYT